MFDASFYATLYPDMAHLNRAQLKAHWLRRGRKEGRVGSAQQMQTRVETGLARIMSEAIEYHRTRADEAPIVVLVRTSRRPAFFERCIDSILAQEYSNFRIVISVDTSDTADYVRPLTSIYDKVQWINVQHIRTTETEPYKFNLYCNSLLQCVEDNEYVVFLDDDDEFAHDKCLQVINDHIEPNIALVWRFMRPDMLVFPKKSNDIQQGEIDTSSVCVHASMARQGCWDAAQAADFRFFTSVIGSNALDVRLLDKILTRTQMTTCIGHFGKDVVRI
jgi:hypothetical protein